MMVRWLHGGVRSEPPTVSQPLYMLYYEYEYELLSGNPHRGYMRVTSKSYLRLRFGAGTICHP